MEMQNEKFLEALMQQEKKDTKPRIIKEYRTVKEQYPWNVLVFPSVFPIIGFCVLAKSLSDFAAKNAFGGYSFLIIALIFFGMGIMFLYPTNSEFGFCKQLREEIKKAQNKGAIYKGEIKGYTFNVRKVIPTETGMQVKLMYSLEVEFLKDDRYITMMTPEMWYHPNAVLAGNRCKVFFYEEKYYFGDFELREKSTDGTEEIPMKGMAGGDV
jgi:hypothetical protein